jgi:hypothetical protein
MRRVRLLTDRVGQGFTQRAGDEVELPPAEAERLVRARQAEYVQDDAKKSREKK